MKCAGENNWNEALLVVFSGKRIIDYLYFPLNIFFSSRLSTVLMVFLQIISLSSFQVLSIMPVPQVSLLRHLPCFLHPFPSFLLHAAMGEFFKLQMFMEFLFYWLPTMQRPSSTHVSMPWKGQTTSLPSLFFQPHPLQFLTNRETLPPLPEQAMD